MFPPSYLRGVAERQLGDDLILQTEENEMVGRKLSTALAAAALVALMGAGDLQGQVAFGAQGNWGSEADFGVGGRVLIDLGQAVPGLDIAGDFNYFFPDEETDQADLTWWEINGNAQYAFPIEESSVRPYLAAGLNVTRIEVDVDGGQDGPGFDFSGDNTEVGLNLGGGIKFPAGSVTPYIEGRAVVSDADQVVVTGGILFGG